jgi:hypothetical protein
MSPGANPTTSEYIAPALYIEGYSVFSSRNKIFVSKTLLAIHCVVKFHNAGFVTHDRESFRLWGDCLFWAVFFNYRSSSKLFNYFFHGKSYVQINFDEKWVGLNFGRFFHKLVSSSWLMQTVDVHLVA